MMNSEILDALVIGTGFAGLGSAIKLKQAGMSFAVIEKSSGVGGVWKANTYPGAQCDVQSHLYSFSFEQYPYWSRAYGMQKEILDYLEHCAQKYEINPHIKFNTEVIGAQWNENEQLWKVNTNKGETLKAKALFLAAGGLSRPSYPIITGREKFKGKMFHSAEWDHSADISGKKIIVIGSAASAIQIVPAIAPHVKKLTILQRTPSWVLPKEDFAYSGLDQWMFKTFPAMQWASREAFYWRLEWRAMAFTHAPFLLHSLQDWAEKYIRKTVKDPVLAEKVVPKYTIGCKRILLSNDFYPAIQRSNVEVLTSGIREMEEDGIILNDGTKVEADLIVAATGFKVTEDAAPFEIKGRNDRILNEEWKDGPEAYLGTTVKGFPNLFMIVGPNTGLAHTSMVYMIESQINYAMKAMQFMKTNRIQVIEVKDSIQDSYNKEIQSRLKDSIWNTGGCVNWYKNKAGKNISLWPGFTFEFRMRTESFNPVDYIQERKKLVIAVREVA